ncbi:hypothetical protein [Mycobacterium sp. 050134]|uniref:hypothetical protein n=1 Tax=Mycobacterium sp. 050134 TaxID=3096111 RepID=UPI002ED88867
MYGAETEHSYGVVGAMVGGHDDRDRAAHRLTDSNAPRDANRRIPRDSVPRFEQPRYPLHCGVIRRGDVLGPHIIAYRGGAVPNPEVVDRDQDQPSRHVVVGLRVPVMSREAHVVVAAAVSSAGQGEQDRGAIRERVRRR